VGNGSATPIAGGDVRSLLSIAGNDTQTPKGGLLVFLHTGERTVGALAIWDVDGRRVFLTQEQALAQAFAALAAIAVDNARLHEQFSEQAKRDSLTQVYNHSYLLDRITDAVANAHQTGAPVSFLMLDIDDFKGFNDRYGHTTGDVVLRSIVQAIRSNVNSTDVIGRWGGEEFGLILYGATAQQAEMVAQRIRTTVANLRLVNHAGESITNPTVSQGIAAFPTHAQTGEQLIEAADSALYRAKACGKDQTAVASTPAANTAEEHA
jgi:diguanylate cyclase (GGDEF)-like protein